MSATIAYDISSQQAVTATFTELQQQLLAQVAAGTGLTWFMDNRKEMYAFAKRASNRKFKQEIEAKWLITRTLSALKEKTDDLIREFFENPRTKTACTVAEAAQEQRKRQKSEGEGGRADQSGADSRKEGERVAEAEDAMEVDGTGPSGVPKAAAPEKALTAPKRRDMEDHEGRKVVRGHVDEDEMKIIKKEEFDALIRPRIETLDEAMRRRMEKGKGKATDEITQQLLAQVAAGTGLTWFMDNRKEMYAFAKRASNRKFKQEIEAKWLITRTLSALKEKTDDLIREFFENPRTKTACTVAEAAQEQRKRQKSEGEGGRADQSGADSRKEGERVAEAEDAMEVDGTGPSGVPKAAAPEKALTAPKRRDMEDHEGRKVVRGHVDEDEMKIIKKEEFDALIRPRIETLDEAMRRRMEKGKGKATDEITVRKIVAPKKCATAKSKSMVAGPSKQPRQRREPSSDEGEEFPEPSDDDEESESGKRRNPRRQAKPRKGSMALPKVEIVERNMRGTTRLPLLGPTNAPGEEPGRLVPKVLTKEGARDKVPPVPAEWQAFVQETNRRMDDMARQIGELGREVNRRLESNSNKLDSVDRELKLVLDMLGRNGLADAEGSVEQRSEPAYQAAGSTDKRTLVGEWAQHHSNRPIAPIVAEPAEPAPPAATSLPPPLPDMPPPPPTIAPPCTPPPASHRPLSPSQAPHPLPRRHRIHHSRHIHPASEDVNMDLASSPAAAAPIITVQEPTPHGNTALANLSHALAQLQVPPLRMTRARSATPTDTLHQSTRLTSRTPAPDDSKAAKRKATSGAVTNTKRLKK
ncbi:hypothetical protein BDN71DRAFT_1594555 [Pleurotus eryngii]|uniref:Uncharacterized protein n=1 Tax=Pleurotus eryngii TaxID=5323 RepID=A0A9P6D865_PLEER|nr:hypothetical protein BDN71DRAFT_1594555 [Pleurotus eryngii]